MKLQKTIGSHMITVICSDQQAEQAQSLIIKLTELNLKPPGLNDGTVVRFGWSDLKLIQKGNELIVHEPDFKKNPLRDYTGHVTDTLDVLAGQVHWLNRLGIQPYECLYSQKILLLKGCLDQKEIYLERSEEEDPSYSGWYIGESGNSKEVTEEDLDSIYVYELLRVRPALMNVLAFPDGYLAAFYGDVLEAVINPEGKNLMV